MKDTRACRSCLNTQCPLHKISEVYRRVYETVCGIKVSPSDGYPYYFCMECKNQIKKILVFRRKSRRAEFVLKEIMNIKREVNTADIVKVDRKKTNLDTSLSRWNPENVSFFTIEMKEVDENINTDKPEAEKGDEKKDKQDIISQVSENNTFVFKDDKLNFDNAILTIDCVEKSEIDAVEAEVDREENIDDMGAGDDDVNMDMGTLDTQEPVEEIDLNDVFKGLPEEESENESESELTKKKKEKEKKKGAKKEKKEMKSQKAVGEPDTDKDVAKILSNFDIRILTLEEQRIEHRRKQKIPTFRESAYKCEICIMIFDNIEQLINHCTEHNTAQGDLNCEVCQQRLSTEDYPIHMAEKHKYMYKCRKCERSVDELIGVKKHECPGPPKESISAKIEKDAEINNLFHIIPLTEELMGLRQDGAGECKCEICGMRLSKGVEYLRHISRHKKPAHYKVQCGICSIWFKTKPPLLRHIQDYHTYTFKCKICDDFEVPSRSLAADHCATHKGSPNCEYCGEYVGSTYRSMHMKKYHFEKVYNKHCVLCGLSFRIDFFLYYHQLYEHKYICLPHPPTESSLFPCKECNIEFFSEQAYQLHLVRAQHEEAKLLPFSCVMCKNIYANEDEFETHKQECKYQQSNLTKYPKPCDLCSVEMRNVNHYTWHMKIRHPDKVGYANRLCEICGEPLNTRNKWFRHKCLVIKRKGIAYNCNICGETFAFPRAYGVHMINIHTKTPYHCTLCDAKFERRMNCRDHILKKHAPELPYKCEMCNRDFNHETFLYEHHKNMHGVITVPTKIKKIKKANISIYKYMKLNVSYIDRQALDDIKFELKDFTHNKIKIITDYDEYFVMNEYNVLAEEPLEVKRIVLTEGNEPAIAIDRVPKKQLRVKKEGKRKSKIPSIKSENDNFEGAIVFDETGDIGSNIEVFDESEINATRIKVENSLEIASEDMRHVKKGKKGKKIRVGTKMGVLTEIPRKRGKTVPRKIKLKSCVDGNEMGAGLSDGNEIGVELSGGNETKTGLGDGNEMRVITEPSVRDSNVNRNINLGARISIPKDASRIGFTSSGKAIRIITEPSIRDSNVHSNINLGAGISKTENKSRIGFTSDGKAIRIITEPSIRDSNVHSNINLGAGISKTENRSTFGFTSDGKAIRIFSKPKDASRIGFTSDGKAIRIITEPSIREGKVIQRKINLGAGVSKASNVVMRVPFEAKRIVGISDTTRITSKVSRHVPAASIDMRLRENPNIGGMQLEHQKVGGKRKKETQNMIIVNKKRKNNDVNEKNVRYDDKDMPALDF